MTTNKRLDELVPEVKTAYFDIFSAEGVIVNMDITSVHDINGKFFNTSAYITFENDSLFYGKAERDDCIINEIKCLENCK